MSTSEYLNLAQVAAYLGWTTRFVECLAVGGKLPGQDIDGQWRFRRADLVDWLDQKMQTLDTARVADFEHRLESELESEGLLAKPHPSPLTSLLQPECIELNLQASTKSDVLRSLVEIGNRNGRVADPAMLVDSLVERESLCSTAFPGGVAVVHPRRPLPVALHGPVLALARTLAPIAFGSADGECTQLFFLLATLDEREHLHALARLVRVLQGGGLAALRPASTAPEVFEILRRREAEIDAIKPKLNEQGA